MTDGDDGHSNSSKQRNGKEKQACHPEEIEVADQHCSDSVRVRLALVESSPSAGQKLARRAHSTTPSTDHSRETLALVDVLFVVWRGSYVSP